MRLLPKAEFTENNAKNSDTGYKLFNLNFRYYCCVFYKKTVNFHSRSNVPDELTRKLKNLMTVYRKNLQHIQKI